MSNTKLTISQRRFVANILAGDNATKAWQAAYPRAQSAQGAAVSAHHALRAPKIARAIDEEVAKTEGQLPTRIDLISEAAAIGRDARDAGVYSAALTSVDLRARLAKLYEREEESGARGYHVLIQALTIQGNGQTIGQVGELVGGQDAAQDAE